MFPRIPDGRGRYGCGTKCLSVQTDMVAQKRLSRDDVLVTHRKTLGMDSVDLDGRSKWTPQGKICQKGPTLGKGNTGSEMI